MAFPCLRGEGSFGASRYSRRDKGFDDGKYLRICCIFAELRPQEWYNDHICWPVGAANRKW